MLQKRYPEAEKLFVHALELDPNSSEALQDLAALYIQQKELPKALARVNTQIERAPKNSAFYYLLGKLLVAVRQPAEAQVALQKAVELDQNNLDAFLVLARLQAEKGSMDEAVASYERVIQKNPDDVRPVILLGMLEEARGNWHQAQVLYQKALQVRPDYPVAANNLAYLLLEHGGNSDVALSYAQLARRGLPNFPPVADTLGWAYYLKGSFRLAIDLLEEAAKKAPDNTTYQYHLGMAYLKANDKARAREHLRRVLQLDPNFGAGNVRKTLEEIAAG